MSIKRPNPINPITSEPIELQPQLVTEPNIRRPEAYSPYGVSFDEEKAYKRQLQRQYKEDLDYLCSLRKKDLEQKQKEKEEEKKKLQLMNNVKIIYIIKQKFQDEQKYHNELTREFNSYNLNEAEMRRKEREHEVNLNLL